MGFRKKSGIPVNKDDELIVKIETMGVKGDGITKIKGYTLFVPLSEIGKTYKVRVIKTLEKYGFTEIIEEIEDE